MFTKIKRIYNEYPNTFKVLTLATFIDRFGSFLLFPFFTLYIKGRFGVQVTVVGVLFMILAGGSIIGSAIGGALADKYGRRILVIFGLVASGLGSILMGIANELYIFFILAGSLGILGEYIGRIYAEVKERPLFIINKTYGFINEEVNFYGKENLSKKCQA